jgi:creatinine amidohydrolase/Fe(II)-dependent formamide hydrolase-like protein
MAVVLAMSEDINLDGKMDDWGPFGPNEGKWLIFSVGNPNEGHGYALPRTIDELSAKAIAYRLEIKSGSRYAAHIPWATDYHGEVAKDWMPCFIPEEEFLEKSIAYMKQHMEIYASMNLPASRVALISSHGGNDPILQANEARIKEELGAEKFILFTGAMAESRQNEFLAAFEELAKQHTSTEDEADELAFKYVQIMTTSGHADHFEHTMAAAIGVLDYDKLQVMNDALTSDFDAALERWPTIGGLGGFLVHGGKYADLSGTPDNDTHGLWNCLRGLRELDHGRMVVAKELGDLLIDKLVTLMAEMLAEE